MTLEKAFAELINSIEFREIAKQQDSQGGKLRIYLTRYKRGQLKSGAMSEILSANGYEIRADKIKKKEV